MKHRAGVTLIELLIAVIIGSIVMFALALPLVAERSMWGRGQRKTEAQRDAQMVMRAIARAARQSSQFSASGGLLQLSSCDGASLMVIQGGPQSTLSDKNQVRMTDCGGRTATLIDGQKSRATQLTFSRITGSLFKVHLEIMRDGREKAVLETTLYARNAG